MQGRTYRLKALLVVFILTAATLAAVAVALSQRKQPVTLMKKPPPPKIMTAPEIAYDPALLAKYEELTREFDFNKSKCTYAGTIDVTDGKDSANTVHGLKFVFCKAGNDFYYLSGGEETIHRGGITVSVKSKQRMVVISNPQVEVKSPLGSIGELQNNLRSESYHLSSKKAGNEKTLSFLNETHVRCKELSVSYDTVSNRLEKIYTRLSDFTDPLNKKKDKVIEISLSTLTDKENIDSYPSPGDVVRKVNGKWKLNSKYAGYELIKL